MIYESQKKQLMNPTINHMIDMLSLLIVVDDVLMQSVGFFSCLVRSDYNMVIVFFCYFIWQQSKDLLTLRIVSYVLFIVHGMSCDIVCV